MGANVIDVDTYGSPYGHWFAALPNIIHPTMFFLTFGKMSMGADDQRLWVPIFGSKQFARKIPRIIRHDIVSRLGIDVAIGATKDYNLQVNYFDGYRTVTGSEYIAVGIKKAADADTSATAHVDA